MNIGQPVTETKHFDTNRIFLSADGTKVATTSGRRWWVHDMDTANSTSLGDTAEVLSVAFSPDGNKVVSGHWNDMAYIWDAESGTRLQALDGHEGVVNSVAFSPDGTRVVSGSDDETVRIWDAESGTRLQVLRGHDDIINSVAFSPDDTRVVSGSDDQTVRIWDAASGTCLQVLRGHNNVIDSAMFSPDGMRVVSGSADATVRIWDAVSGACVVLRGHNNTVYSVGFSPDGEKVVSGSEDETVRIWDAASGQLQVSLDTIDHSTQTVLFTSDAQVMACGYNAYVHSYATVYTFNLDVWELATPVNWYNVARNPVMYRLNPNTTSIFVDALSEYLGPHIKKIQPALNGNLTRIILSYVPHASLEDPSVDVIGHLIKLYRRV